jgi:cupin fold WbuC family metalloprotein
VTRPPDRVSDAVWVARGDLVVVGPAEVALLKERLGDAPRRRNRVCAHPDGAAALQEMLVLLGRGTYIPPHRHRDRAESLLAIEGEADAVFFGEAGEIEEVLRLGPPGSGRDFFYRTAPPRYHTLVLRSERFLFLEATTGPFRPETSESAPWAPAEGDAAAVGRWEQALEERLRRFGGRV